MGNVKPHQSVNATAFNVPGCRYGNGGYGTCSRHGNGGRMHVILNGEPLEEVDCF